MIDQLVGGGGVCSDFIETWKEENSSIRSGIGLETEEIGNLDYPHFISNNKGQREKFPGGPWCRYKGKILPCFVTFQYSGSIKGIILKQVIHHLDNLELFNDSL